MVEYQLPVIAVEKSNNKKIGVMSATYVSQESCPTSCVLYRNGCYAESGTMGIHTNRLNKVPPSSPEAIAQAEADAIDGLTGRLPLRVHVVGDCSTPEAARIVGSAMVRHEAKHGQPAYTYTHAWREVAHADWQGATVLASCETVEQVQDARARGYATALVVQSSSGLPRGQGMVKCPNQINGTTCVDCGLCLNPRLGEYGITIVFETHGARKGKANAVLS